MLLFWLSSTYVVHSLHPFRYECSKLGDFFCLLSMGLNLVLFNVSSCSNVLSSYWDDECHLYFCSARYACFVVDGPYLSYLPQHHVVSISISIFSLSVSVSDFVYVTPYNRRCPRSSNIVVVRCHCMLPLLAPNFAITKEIRMYNSLTLCLRMEVRILYMIRDTA